jgi:hypothetical protein
MHSKRLFKLNRIAFNTHSIGLLLIVFCLLFLVAASDLLFPRYHPKEFRLAARLVIYLDIRYSHAKLVEPPKLTDLHRPLSVVTWSGEEPRSNE